MGTQGFRWKTSKLPIGTGTDIYTYFAWRNQPDWFEGVVIKSSPGTGASLTSEASITPRDMPDVMVEYDNIVEVSARSEVTRKIIDKPFQHFRLNQPANADGEFVIYHNGQLAQTDEDGAPTDAGGVL